MSNDSTLLVIYPGRDVTETHVFTLLVAETGEGLANHLCSHSGYAYDDLYGNRPERKEKYAERFGKVEVKFIDQVDLTEEELLRRNKEFHK